MAASMAGRIGRRLFGPSLVPRGAASAGRNRLFFPSGFQVRSHVSGVMNVHGCAESLVPESASVLCGYVRGKLVSPYRILLLMLFVAWRVVCVCLLFLY